MARRRIFVHLPIFITCFATLCCSSLVGGSEQADVFVVYPNATRVWSGPVGDTTQLRYHLDAPYPASNVISWIAARLQKANWTALANDFLNPDLSPSRMRNWDGGFLEGLKDPGICVHMWTGDWKDPNGNIVRYIFRYRHRGCDTLDLTELEVTVIYMPATVVHRIQKVIGQSKKERRAE